jgi:(R,R)-butanediol dehydrogenase / meso-butanediol dehydrogenase / diacetyl reductase
VHVVDVNPDRTEKARSRGFTVHNPEKCNIVEAVMEATGNKGADVVFDAAGAPSMAETATKLVKSRGQVVVVAVYNNPPKVNYRDVNFNELDIIGVRVYNYEDYGIAVKMMNDGRIRTEGLATHVFNLEDAQKGTSVHHGSCFQNLSFLQYSITIFCLFYICLLFSNIVIRYA